MLKLEVPGGDNNSWARVCDTCHSAPCIVYCRADSAYLGTSCDTRIHVSFICEACEQAPAAFLCKADSASLCASCDADIHSANPLARRHQRVSIMPVGSGCHYRSPVGAAVGSEYGFLGPSEGGETVDEEEDHEDEDASWLLLNNPAGKDSYKQNRNGFLLGEEAAADEYLDLFENYSGAESHFPEQYNQHHQEFNASDNNYATDSVVPVAQSAEGKDQQYQNFLFGTEFETKSAFDCSTSISHGVPVSSLDVGIVPNSTISDLSLSNPRPPKDTIDLFSAHPMQMATQLSPLDREARVMRYREKKKTRKFEKTIRYASRKAYAETRPRIKGRFAKRSNVEAEVDEMFPNSLLAGSVYGIVPSF